MTIEDDESQIEGVIRAPNYGRGLEGKQFLGAQLKPDSGKTWVLDYFETSPYHAFDGRRVIASGRPCMPPLQCLGNVRHFAASTLRVAEITNDVQVIEVGSEKRLRGRLEFDLSDSSGPSLAFIGDAGEAFTCFNHPPGLVFGRIIEISAFPLLTGPAAATSKLAFIWVICPHSSAHLWEWRAHKAIPR